MGRVKFSKEVKIEACEKYHSGSSGFVSIAKEVGCHEETLRRWYFKYIQHGSSVFDSSSKRKDYDKKFKLLIIETYLSGNYSMTELSSKYNISVSMVGRWVQKYNNGIEIKSSNTKKEVCTMKSKKTTYEERLEIVKWIISNQMNYKEAANHYGVTYALVYKWTRAYLKDGEEALKYKKRGPKPPGPIKDHNLSELEKLRQELAEEKKLRKRKELEIEILKKKEEFEKDHHYPK